MIKFNFRFKSWILALVGVVCLGVTNVEAVNNFKIDRGNGDPIGYKETLKQAISYATAGTNVTITLLNDYTATTDDNYAYPLGSSAPLSCKLDLQTYKITQSAKANALTINGGTKTFTITASSEDAGIYCTWSSSPIAVQVNSGTLVLEGGTIAAQATSGDVYGALRLGASNDAKVIINGGTVKSTATGNSYALLLSAPDAAPSATINGGTITAKGGASNAFGVRAEGASGHPNSSELTVTGNPKIAAYGCTNNEAIVGFSKRYLQGGYYTSRTSGSYWNNSGGSYQFIDIPSDDVLYNATEAYRHHIVPKSLTSPYYEAKVQTSASGSNYYYYLSFRDAFDYAKTQDGATTFLLRNVSYTSGASFNYNPTSTIANTLNVGTYTLSGSGLSGDKLLNIGNGTYTITGTGSVSYTQNKNGAIYGIVVAAGARLDITGGAVSCSNTNTGASANSYCCAINGANSKLNISGSSSITAATSSSSAASAAVRSNGGTTTISGSPTFTAKTGVLAGDSYAGYSSGAKLAQVNITGGTFTCSELAVKSIRTPETTTNYVYGMVDIQGGKFHSDSENLFANGKNDASYAVKLKGGYFNETSGTTHKDQLLTYCYSNNQGYAVFSSSTPGYSWEVKNGCFITLKKNTGDTDGYAVATKNSTSLSELVPPTKTGYHPTGEYWTAASSGSKVINANQTYVSNVSGYTNSDGEWTLTSRCDLYPRWTANTYTVHFNGNGNTGGSTADQSFTYGTAQNLRANGFTKTGYIFAGWATSASGEVVYSNSQSVSNLTTTNGGTVNLYAKWSKVVATVKVGSGSPTPYTDFTTAFDYAKTQAGAVLQLQDNITFSSANYINYNPSTAIANTLDLNGYTLTGGNSGDRLLNLSRGTYTIKDTKAGNNGKLFFSKSGATYGVVANANTTLNVESGQIYCENEGGGVRGIILTDETATVNISGTGKVIGKGTADVYGIYTNYGTLNVSGSGWVEAISTSGAGAYGIGGFHNSSITITNGTVKATTKTNTAFCCVSKNTSTLSISNGTFTAASSLTDGTSNKGDNTIICVIVYPDATNRDITISGGTFTSEAVGTTCCGIRSLGGTTTINNNPFFTSKVGVLAGDFPGGQGTHTAKVIINGGTFKCTNVPLSAQYKVDGNGNVVSGDITVNGGKFYTTLATPYFFKADGGTLTLHGGYYNETSSTVHKDQLENLTEDPYHPVELTSAEKSSVDGDGMTFKYKIVAAYDLTFAVNTSGYGTVSPTSITRVPTGTTPTVSSNTVTVNGTTVTATPTTATAQYSYAFNGWSNATAAVTADRTITANFTRTTRQYTITWKNEAGTSTLETDANQNYGTATAFNQSAPTKAATAQYTYTFDGWTTEANGGGTFYANGSTPTVSGNATYYAHFSATLRNYTVTVERNNNAYGTVDKASVTNVPYGSTFSTSGNKFTINGTTVTATPTAATAQYTYAFSSWTNASGTVTGNVTVTANFTRTVNTYTITWKSEDGNSTLETDASQAYGATTAYNSTTPTKAATAQYTYTFDGWTTAKDGGGTFYANGSTPTVSGAATYYAHFSSTANVASVTPSGGSTSYYTSIGAAFTAANAATADVTITLLANCSSAAVLNFAPTNAINGTLNLNGKTLTGSVDKVLTINKSGKTFTITDSSNGKLVNTINANDIRYAVWVTAGTLVVSKGTVVMNNPSTSGTSGQARAIYVSAGAAATISGSASIQAVAKQHAYGIYTGGTTATTTTLTVSGGSISAETSTGDNAYGVWMNNTTFTMSAGTIDATAKASTAVGVHSQGTSTKATLQFTGGTINATTNTGSTAHGIYPAWAVSGDCPALTIPSGSTVSVTATAQTTGAYAIITSWATSDIQAGTFKAETKTGNSAAGFYGNHNNSATISGGTWTVISGAKWAWGVQANRGTVNITGGTYNVSGSSEVGGVHMYAIATTNTADASYYPKVNVSGSPVFNVEATSDAWGIYANYNGTGTVGHAGTCTVTSGTFNVNSTSAKGLYIREAGSYASGNSTPKANISGGKFNVTGSSAIATTTIAANTAEVITGGYYSVDGGLSNYTHPTKDCAYRVFTISPALESKYNYKVAQFYTISYKKGASGTGTEYTDYKAHGDNIALRDVTFTRTGYTQDGWSTSDGDEKVYNLSAVYTANSAVTLYPHWSINTYTVTIVKNVDAYGTISRTSITGVPYGSTFSTSSNTFTVNGTTVTATAADATAQYSYAFSSWTNATGTVTGNVTVTANFTRTARTYTITLNTNGGTINAGNVTSYTYGTGATLPTNVTKTGYSFAGWFDNIGLTGSAVTTVSSAATGNKEYWAKWTPVGLTFTGGTNSQWSNSANWSPACVPTSGHDIVIQKPCSVDVQNAAAKSIVIYNNGSDKTGRLTVGPNMGLNVEGTITKTTDGSNSLATATSDILLQSTSAGNASLIFNNTNSCQATVQMYSKATYPKNGTATWQYIGVPLVGESYAPSHYYGSWLYKWDITTNGWTVIPNGGYVNPWIGYCITQREETTYEPQGTLLPTNAEISLNFRDGATEGTDAVFANSWTAPIQIAQMTEGDFVNVDPVIYLFNTGLDANNDGKDDNTSAGTYITIPINTAGTGDIPGKISSLQGFDVYNTGVGAKVKLRYADHVRPKDARTINNGAMYAPKRTQEEKPTMMKLTVTGSRYATKVHLFGREDFSTNYDAGWDGKNMNEPAEGPLMYALREDGTKDAVSAIPAYEGTVIGFHAGEDNVYTFTFTYDGEETLYLNDLQEKKSTLINAENSYTFFTNEADDEARFIISATAYTEVATDIDSANDEHASVVRKVVINDKVYIIRGGRMYSTIGGLVK